MISVIHPTSRTYVTRQFVSRLQTHLFAKSAARIQYFAVESRQPIQSCKRGAQRGALMLAAERLSMLVYPRLCSNAVGVRTSQLFNSGPVSM